MFELDNGLIHVSMTDDGGRLCVRGPGGCYEAEDYLFARYGGFMPLDLPRFGRPVITVSGQELRLEIRDLVWYARWPGHGYIKPVPAPDIRFVFRIRLEKDEVLFITEAPQGMDEENLYLEFPKDPLRWDTRRTGYWCGTLWSLGSMVRYPSADRVSETSQPMLPLAGYFSPEGGIGIRSECLFDYEFKLSVNQGSPEGRFSSVQEFIRGKNQYERVIRMRFFPAGSGYVELAKWHRAGVMREKRFVSLKEKCAADPEVAKLAGSVIWKHNVYTQEQLPPGVEKDYALYVQTRQEAEDEGKLGNWTAREVFDTAHRAGFDRVCILNTGWNFMGYDSGYPTRLPPNPERGTEAQFRAAAEYGRSLSPDYIFSVHDNYRDAYSNSPEFSEEEMMHDINGIPVRGLIWRGGRSWQLCGPCGLKYARRDMPKVAAMCGRGAIYLDVQGGSRMRNCWHPDHPCSQADDARWRLEIFREAKKHFGALASEWVKEFAVGAVDLCAYPVIREMKSYDNVSPIPLYQLVYHDSIYTFTGQGVAGVSGLGYRCRMALYGMLPWDFSPMSLRISREMRETCFAEMLSHEIMADGFERSVFSDGTEVTANFGKAEQDGIQPGDFRIRKI